MEKKGLGGIVSEEVFCERFKGNIKIMYRYVDRSDEGKQKAYQEPLCPKFDSDGLCEMHMKQNLGCPYFIDNRPKVEEVDEVPEQMYTSHLFPGETELWERVHEKAFEPVNEKVAGEICDFILEHSDLKTEN